MRSERCYECGQVWLQDGPADEWRFPSHYDGKGNGTPCPAGGTHPDTPLLVLIESVLRYRDMVNGVEDYPSAAVWLLARFREDQSQAQSQETHEQKTVTTQ